MGEYAKTLNGATVKIGTCEEMFYIRYEDRMNVSKVPNSLDPQTTLNLFWRLPFPDEDDISIGGYTDHDRAERLWSEDDRMGAQIEISENPGTIQLHHESGLLVNVPCHHGQSLPTITGAKTFWNGKSWFLELKAIKNTTEGVFPVVHCRFCHNKWRFDWEEIMPYLHGEMKTRLSKYAEGVK